MHGPVLPSEILDIVPGHLEFSFHPFSGHADRRDLLSCSSVCMQWRVRVLVILLRCVHFKMYPVQGIYFGEGQSTALDRFPVILDYYPCLGNSVSRVRFRTRNPFPAQEFFPKLLDVLSARCKRIRTLSTEDAVAMQASCQIASVECGRNGDLPELQSSRGRQSRFRLGIAQAAAPRYRIALRHE